MSDDSLAKLNRELIGCTRCSRLVAWREEAAAHPPRRHEGETYWARPVPGFGDPKARVLILGLAPGAHGSNRTGRAFTGDGSGDFLYPALNRSGFASQPIATSRDDGLRLRDAYITAVVRCAPPANKPLPAERDNCLPYLERELALLTRVRVLLCFGSFAWDGALRALRAMGHETPRPKPRFGHGVEVRLGPYRMLGCFHPSQQNTFTGKLTPQMLDIVLERARELAR
jgi:uracil-DNA glycosylase